jgi:hypothetical protein
MSSVLDYKKCKQCSYEQGYYDFDCSTSEWELDCPRCGHGESFSWITDKLGNRVGWKHESLDGRGAVWATSAEDGISTYFGLRSAQRAEEAAQRMRDDIAQGKLDGEQSYVTKWNPETMQAEVIAGKWCDKEQQ